ncbi:MAG TPA: carboxypeptidase regulatory-like domain-containing protein [Vicinamibacterales bacterium]|nr:carboxypeptidase regulatory-like domain-containing protein [Vicinamibacterales bacterium]
MPARIVPLLAALAWLLTAAASAQVRTTGQIVGVARDPTGAVVPDAVVEITDRATGAAASTRTGRDGGFVFPALQPGRYLLVANAAGFQPFVVEEVVVETGRATSVAVDFQVAALAEEVRVEGRAAVIETSSSTVSTTVRNQQIAKLPLAGRNILDFALLTPGTATSSAGRFSTFNGLPGGAINITLDGINNNSQRFRSGGTSFFVFAPVRLGAIEEVTVSTAGLTADAGAEGAVQVQFVTRRGTNVWRAQIFDQMRHEALNANSYFNTRRGLPKTKIRQHEFGANLGGPLVRGRLFFFTNYEQIHQPGESTITRTVLTPEAQQGLFRYVGTDGVVRTADLLAIARAAGLPSAIDPFVVEQFRRINATLGSGSLQPSDLLRNSFSFIIPTRPKNVYPTARVDWQASPSLAVRGILNLWWRDLARNPQFPGMDFVNGGFTSTYYILSTGADWTVRPNVFNQVSFGVQSNFEEFNPGNTPAVYEIDRRVAFPLGLTPALPTGNVLPIPRNNPVYNLIDTITILHGNHTFTLGGTFRRTAMWESIWGGAAGGPLVTLGVAAGDPASAVFTAATLPRIRSTDLPNALALYALLTGRISAISGVHNVDERTHRYGPNPVVRREAQNVGGVYFQDAWRLTPELTLNYGLRWEFTGPAHNTNGIYTSPAREHLLGPSRALFRPGTLDGVPDPQIELRPRPYKGDYVNPAPNAGFAWNPQPEGGLIGRLLGRGRSVIRGSVGVNYYDEGLIAFQSAAGGNPGLTQQLFLNPGMPGFPPGGLLLSSPLPPLATFPAAFAFPMPQALFTFASGFSTVDPDLRTPFVTNWAVGLQRELWRDAAVEIRYVGNRGAHLWRFYDLNEVNIFENGFLEEFRRAQRNLQINQANNRPGFANNGLPGQVPLPLFEAAFGASAGQPALPAASGFANGTFITLLEQGQAGALANALAGNSLYLCRLVGAALPACASLGYRGAGRYPINLFQANPFAAGRSISLLTDDGTSRYGGLQLQFRQRMRAGLTLVANYTYSKATSNRYSDSPATAVTIFTHRDPDRNVVPHIFDLRHAFQSYWTYELPFGRERAVPIGNRLLDAVAGGWSVSGILRIQSGRPFYLTSGRSTVNQRDAGVVLVGITAKDLQKMIRTSRGPGATELFVDPRLIGPDGRANPDYLRSPTEPGEWGELVFLYGPGLWNLDLGVAKRFRTGTRATISLEALFLNAFNHTDFLVGGASSDTGFAVNINSTTFGQTTSTPGGPRNVQVRLQIDF